MLQISMFLLSNIGIFLSQFIVKRNGSNNTALAVISGLFFWVGIISATVVTIILSKQYNFTLKDHLLCVISFFKTKAGMIVDVILILSFILFIVFTTINNTGRAPIIFLSIFIFSFEMHCAFNEKYYKYIISKLEEKKDGKV